ncbi:Ig-like domain-containing protein [Neobacillus sp. SuZ13]|uniref:Ig-like domain-containing protein n=1 Tax=Neobacillus sp. SuZ13 TaxID=3047875 RepID=UPI0024C0DB1E|nr:Ig-like domain-containing protein [Neobacillus sp. SuZ13]WHY66863.1 Ig-like domain-containing protein [Neobacillus sp. SuZ13]
MAKKWISVLMAAFLFAVTIFSSAPVGFAEDDVTPLKLKAASVNLKDAKIGDTIVFTFEVEEDLESGIAEDGHGITIKHSSGSEIASNLFYKGDNTFEFRWKLDSSTLKGTWSVDYISLYDAAGNKSEYYRNDPLIEGLTYHVVDGVEDTTPPRLTNMALLTKDAQAGGQVKMTFSISEISGLGESYVYFKHERTENWLQGKIVYNSNAKRYEAILDVPKVIQNGKWTLDFLRLADIHGNEEWYRASEHTFLGGKTINITGGTDDFDAPVFKSIKLSTTSVYGGDTFTVWVGAEDKSGLKEGSISFKSANGSFWAPFEWDMYKNMFRADITLPPGQMSGQYSIEQIYLRDNVDNLGFIYDPQDGSFPVLTVKSVFTGVDSIFMVRGESFDPLAGVKAFSSKEGDMTKLVTVSGTADSQTNGIYLLKYAVTGPTSGFTFKGYRWITVNDGKNVNPTASTMYFNTDVKLGVAQNEKLTLASGSKVTTINQTTSLKTDGAYQVSAASDVGTSSTFSRAAVVKLALGNKISFVIDKKAPAAPSGSVVTDKSSAVSGKAEAYANVALYLNGKFIKNVRADRSGAFKFPIGKQSIGTEIKVNATDRASNMGPFRTVKVVHAPTLNTVSNKSVSVSGLTLPYATVKVYISGKYYKSGKADSKGKYKIKISKQKAGKSISVTSTYGKDKKVSPAVKTTVLDKIAPGTPTVYRVSASSSSVSGKGEARAIVYVFNGKKQVGKGTVSSKGNFKVRIAKQKKGSYLSVYLVDKAGNKSKKKTAKVY